MIISIKQRSTSLIFLYESTTLLLSAKHNLVKYYNIFEKIIFFCHFRCRIKTNGSLPRNGLHHAWSDDDSSSWSADGGPSTGEPRPSSPVPPPSPGAPYENVMLVYPGSPRTRIRTIAPARCSHFPCLWKSYFPSQEKN